MAAKSEWKFVGNKEQGYSCIVRGGNVCGVGEAKQEEDGTWTASWWESPPRAPEGQPQSCSCVRNHKKGFRRRIDAAEHLRSLEEERMREERRNRKW